MPMAMSNQEPLPFPSEPLLYLKPGATGYFSLLVKTPNRMRQDSFPMAQTADVIRCVDPRRDTYITPNQYIRRNRRLVNLWQLNTIFADLDTYKIPTLEGLSPEQLTFQCLDTCSDIGIPLPSLILFSGRGLYVKWILDRPLPRQALPRWNAVQRVVTMKLKGIGADQNSIDGSRVLRLEQTANTKTGLVARVMWPENWKSPVNYDFEVLCREILPLPREELSVFTKCKSEVKRIWKKLERQIRFTAQSLNWARLDDIRKVAQLRGWPQTQGNPDGMRDPFIYTGTIFVSWFSSGLSLSQESMALAKEFAPLWGEKKWRSKVGSYFKAVEAGRKYKFKNQKLIDLLQITPEEERQLKTIISHTEKANRRRTRDKAQSREIYESVARERRAKAIELKQNGKSYRQISIELGCSPAEVFRLIG